MPLRATAGILTEGGARTADDEGPAAISLVRSADARDILRRFVE